MNNKNLKRFEQRVRIVRAWRGLAIGLSIGAAICGVWAVLDWMKVSYAEWSQLGWVLLACGLIGTVVGFLLRVSSKALSDSIDRRGGLQNRLSTSLEVDSSTSFGEALQSDATSKLAGLKPQQLYPVRVGRWQSAAFLLAVLASTIFLLANSPVMLSPAARKEREEMKKIGQSVERIAKPILDSKSDKDMTEAEKRLADELKKMQRDLQKGRMTKEEAMQKANDLAKKAEELTNERAEMTEKSLAKAETAMEKLQKAALEKSGIKMDPETAMKLSKMSPSDIKAEQKNLEDRKQELEQKKAELESKLDSIKNQLENKNLSPEARKALEEMQKQLEKMLKELEKELAELQKAIQDLLNSEKIQELMKMIQEHPAMKEIEKILADLAKTAAEAKAGDTPKLTKEDIEKMMERVKELKKELEELAEKLKDPAAMDEFMEALKEAMQNAGGT